MMNRNTLFTLLLGAALGLPAAAQDETVPVAEQTGSGSDVAQALEGRCIDPAYGCFTYSLREGWFAEAGLDMTMLNPYNKDFGEVFPKGRSHGLSVAVGKKFSREIGLRFRLNWENGLPLFRNKRLEWFAPVDKETLLSTNMDEGGAMFLYMDVPVSLLQLCRWVGPTSRWDFLVTPRAGLGGNLGLGSWSPYVGVGLGTTYRLTRRTSLYADLTYAGITSEFFSGVPETCTGMGVSTGFNGIISLHGGVRVDLGRKW